MWTRRNDGAREPGRGPSVGAGAATGPLEGSRCRGDRYDGQRWSNGPVALTVETVGEPLPLLAEIEVTLFRVAQEALTNVAKHARASRVGVTLSYLDDMVLLDVRDDGVGFCIDAVNGNGASGEGEGFGLSAMRQRVRQVAGTLTIESAPARAPPSM